MSPGENEPPDGGNHRAATEMESSGKLTSTVYSSTTDGVSQHPPLSIDFPLSDNPGAYVVALGWLDCGVNLLPLQPGTKRLVPGFGPYLQHVDDLDRCWFWFSRRRCNMAVVTGSGLVVLDVDEPTALESLLSKFPDLRRTFTIKTKRGVHLYLQNAPADLRSFKGDGIEFKSCGGAVVTWPSRIGDFVYRPLCVTAPILEFPPSLSPLSGRKDAQPARDKTIPTGDDLLSRIKSAWPIAEVAESLHLVQLRNGRWLRGRCPVHGGGPDNLWVDTERGLFGCHACGWHGDALNMYAFVHRVELQDAIREMAKRLT